MKVSFLFMARNEVNNSNLWEKYFSECDFNYSISVYCDSNYSINNEFFKKYQVQHNIFKNREINVEVKYDFLNRNLEDSDFFIFLTEDSIPIKKGNTMYNFLTGINKSVFTYELDPHVTINDGREKYGSVRSFGFPEDLRYKNNDWLCLSKKHAEIIVKNREDCFQFNSGYGGEHFIGSILNKNNELSNVLCEKFVVENWDGYNGRYPSILSINDFEKIKSIINNHKYGFFLRKFNNEESNLDLINKIYDYS